MEERIGIGGKRAMSMIEDIQSCADQVLAVLSRAGQMNILRLAETLGERSILTYQALGWLAREGRVRYSQTGTRVFVTLAKNPAPTMRGERSDRAGCPGRCSSVQRISFLFGRPLDAGRSCRGKRCVLGTHGPDPGRRERR
jgi:hypothetical protein